MIIDDHNHPDWCGHDLDKYLANMDENNIDVTWLLSWEAPTNEYDPSYDSHTPIHYSPWGPIPFERCLSYKERAPKQTSSVMLPASGLIFRVMICMIRHHIPRARFSPAESL